MAWVKGIREVTHVTVAADGGKVGMKRGPVMTKQARRIADLAPESFARTIGRTALVFLPEHTGAGPCGTHARGLFKPRMIDPAKFLGQRFTGLDPMPPAPALSPLAWSMTHLLPPLAEYYATYEPPMRFGAKPGPRGRRAA